MTGCFVIILLTPPTNLRFTLHATSSILIQRQICDLISRVKTVYLTATLERDCTQTNTFFHSSPTRTIFKIVNELVWVRTEYSNQIQNLASMAQATP